MIHTDKNKHTQGVRRLRHYLQVLTRGAFVRRKYIHMGQLLENFLAFCATLKFVTVFTRPAT